MLAGLKYPSLEGKITERVKEKEGTREGEGELRKEKWQQLAVESEDIHLFFFFSSTSNQSPSLSHVCRQAVVHKLGWLAHSSSW